MAILAQDIRDAMSAVLDDEGSERYLDQQDIIPAINGSLRRFNALVGSVFAENKGGEELFREITYSRIIQTNAFGGFVLNEAQLGHKVWTIVAIYAEPVMSPASPQITPLDDDESPWRSDVVLRRPGKFHVRRITLEQAAQTERNRFLPGTEALAAGPRRSYAYYIVGNRAAADFQPGDVEVMLVPESITGKKLIGVSYLRGVDPISTLSDLIPYPPSAFQMLRDLALNEVSIKQGAQPLFNVTTAEVRALLGTQA